MGQEFLYPNLLTGTRSAGGLATLARGGVLIPRVALAAAPGGWAYALSNATKSEKFAITRETFRLRHGVSYSLSLWAAATGNMDSMDIFVLAYGTFDDGWVAARRLGTAPASGGGGSPGVSNSTRRAVRTGTTTCASTTTAARTARSRRSGSRTPCSARARSPTPGHRLLGRCGRR